MLSRISSNRAWFHTISALSLLLLGDVPSLARTPGIGTAQPQNYVSPDGTYALFIDPADRYGRGSANYRLTRNGVEVWSAEKPYALREVAVSNDGHAAGMVYRSAGDDSESGRSEQYLHIVILRVNGAELLNETRQRYPAPYTHGPTLPEVEQFISDLDNDRIVVRVRTRQAEWWTYRLSTGEVLARIEAKAIAPKVDNLQYVVDVRTLHRTPLLLVHWYALGADQKLKDADGVFALVDLETGPVWSFEAPNDYADIDWGWGYGGGPAYYFEKHPAISATPTPGRFDIRLFAARQRVSFFAQRAQGHDWTVTELGRIKVPDAPPEDNSPPPDVQPLTYLGELELVAPDIQESALSGLWDFTFDSQGRIYVVRRSKDDAITMLSLGPEGEILRQRPLPPSTLPGMGRHWTEVPRHKDDRYIEIRKEGEKQYSAWSIHLPTWEERPLEHYPGGSAGSLSRFADGGLVMLDAEMQNSALIDRLRCFGAAGDLVWELRGNTGDNDLLGIGPRGVVVTTKEHVVLLNIDSLQMFDRAGNHIKKVSLSGAFGRRPVYVHGLVADAEGGFLIADSGNPPVVVRYHADGSLRSRWSPRHPNGKTFDLRPQIRVAPDGRLWTGDGRSLLRLTDDGVVDLVIGPQHDPDRLDGIAAFNAGPGGNLYVVAEGTSNVHVFDAGGKFKQIIRPEPTNVAGTVRESFIAVNDTGEVYLKKPATRVFAPPDEYLRFSPDGKELDPVTFEPSIPVGEFLSPGWVFQPRTGYRCGIYDIAGDRRLVIVDPPDKLIREVGRRPNGRWFGEWTTVAVAPDGSIAVLDHDIFGDEKVYELDLFTAAGEPMRTIRLPPPVKRYTGLCRDDKRAIVAGNAEAVIVDLVGGRTERFALVPPGVAEGRWSAFMPLPTSELLLFDHKRRKVHRYQLPAPHAQSREQASAAVASRPPDPADAAVKSPWVQRYVEVLDSLPKPAPCVLYAQKVDRGERLVTDAQAADLPDDERAGLRAIDMTGCGIRWDAPRVYARLLDIAAGAGLADVQGKRILDFGCCDLRHVQALARLGVHVTNAQLDYSITTMCNDWTDVGDVVGPSGEAGHIRVVRASEISPDTATTVLGEDYALITVRNLMHNPGPEDYFSSEKWWNLAVAKQKAEIPARLLAMLEPGGWLLIYNVGLAPIPVENSIDRPEWESAGFTVAAFDTDDLGAAVGIGAELDWADHAQPLPTQLRAKYTLLQRPLPP